MSNKMLSVNINKTMRQVYFVTPIVTPKEPPKSFFPFDGRYTFETNPKTLRYKLKLLFYS